MTFPYLADISKAVIMLSNEANEKTLGPFSPKFNLHKKLKEILNSFPDDITEKATGRL